MELPWKKDINSVSKRSGPEAPGFHQEKRAGGSVYSHMDKVSRFIKESFRSGNRSFSADSVKKSLFFSRGKEPGKRRLPVTIRGKRVYVLPTRHGLLFLVVLLFMTAGSINYNNNLGFLFTFLIGSMALVSLVHTHGNLSGLMIQSIRSTPVFNGENAIFLVTLHAGDLPRRAILLKFKEGEPKPSDLHRGTESSISIPVPSTGRGVLEPGTLFIETKYPFGLFFAWSKIDSDAECLVYPLPLSGPPVRAASPGIRETGEGGKGLGINDFTGLKAYRPGDPISHISWKVYSKGQGLFTKEFRGGRRTSPVFDMDLLGGMGIEEKLSRITHMVLEAQKHNLEYGIKLSGRLTGPGRGRGHDLDCLRKLATFGSPGQ